MTNSRSVKNSNTTNANSINTDIKNSNTKDPSATRILLIIKALCNGKKLNELSLKDFDFNISQRTFQRDIKKIKDFFTENYANLQGGGACKNHSKVCYA